VTKSAHSNASDTLLKKRRHRELIIKIALTSLVLIGAGTAYYYIIFHTSAAVSEAIASEETQQELKAISLAAQQFHKDHHRWPRDMFELRNDPKMPFVPRRDRWGRGYIYRSPKEGVIGRIETYGQDGLARGRKDDGDAAYEFNTETAKPAAPLPTSTITYFK
jgi:hypothetical protein